MKDIDYTIIQSCLDGDVDAYSKIVDKYQQIIFKQVYWYVDNAHEAEELAHEVFVQAFLSLKNYQAKAPFIHWLRRIASNMGCNYIREMKKKKQHFSIEGWDFPVDDVNYCDRHGASVLLKELLNLLNPEDRMALTLLYVEELTVKEIAERMLWNKGMVKMRVFRAKNKIKKYVCCSDKREDYEAVINYCL